MEENTMQKEIRTALRDEGLSIEAYHFEGIAQPFPSHFHDYYVIGLVEKGERCLSCRSQEYLIRPGDILLFNPGDSHSCVQTGTEAFHYRAVNIEKEVMLDLAEEITGSRTLPGFSQTVIHDQEAACCLGTLHQMIMNGSEELGKEENLLLLLSLLIRRYGQPFEACIPECREEIEKACAYMEQHCAQRISLDQICRHTGLSKSTLLRAFAKSKGVTPYRYLEAIRISQAKKLLERGVSPIEAAWRTGFYDQSHFTNYFSRFIGLAPGLYRDIFMKKKSAEGEHHGT